MTNATPSLSPVLHEIHVNVVSAEEASLGVAELPNTQAKGMR
jgi:hypothetical protein